MVQLATPILIVWLFFSAVKILFKKDEIEIGFFDTGLPAVPENITHRNLDDIKPGGLGTYFIKEIMDGAVFKKDKKGWVNHCLLYTSDAADE